MSGVSETGLLLHVSEEARCRKRGDERLFGRHSGSTRRSGGDAADSRRLVAFDAPGIRISPCGRSLDPSVCLSTCVTTICNACAGKLPAIAAAAERIKARSFTIDGEAVVLGPDGLSRFDELRRRSAARPAILYAFDLIEHDGDDLRDRPFLDRKAALARLLCDTKAGILLNEHFAEDGATVFEHACRLGAEGIVSKKVDGTYRSGRCPVWNGQHRWQR